MWARAVYSLDSCVLSVDGINQTLNRIPFLTCRGHSTQSSYIDFGFNLTTNVIQNGTQEMDQD